MSHSGELKIIGGSTQLLVEMVLQIDNSMWNYMWIIPFQQVFLGFWNTKTHELLGAPPVRLLDPWCHDGICDENGTNGQCSAKLHVNFIPDVTL